MPFGLKNAGATYQRMMTRMFRKKIRNTVEVYIDDMVVKSKEDRGMSVTLRIYLKNLSDTGCASMSINAFSVWGLVNSLPT